MEIVFTEQLLLGGMKQVMRRADQWVELQFVPEKSKAFWAATLRYFQLQKQSRFLQH